MPSPLTTTLSPISISAVFGARTGTRSPCTVQPGCPGTGSRRTASTAPAGTDQRPPPCTGPSWAASVSSPSSGSTARVPQAICSASAMPERQRPTASSRTPCTMPREARNACTRRGVRRGAGNPLDEEPPQDEVAVRRLILEAEASAGMPLDREGRGHRVARELGEELDVRVLVGRRGLDGLAVHDRAGPGGWEARRRRARRRRPASRASDRGRPRRQARPRPGRRRRPACRRELARVCPCAPPSRFTGPIGRSGPRVDG